LEYKNKKKATQLLVQTIVTPKAAAGKTHKKNEENALVFF
jgi:hypothetical protein